MDEIVILSEKDLERIQKNFGKNVRRRRKYLKMAQEELAQKTQLHASYICSLEAGKRNVSLANIWKLTKALQCSANELFKTN